MQNQINTMIYDIRKQFDCSGADLRPEYIKQTPLRHFLNYLENMVAAKYTDKRISSKWRRHV
jgi:hypothetical protein